MPVIGKITFSFLALVLFAAPMANAEEQVCGVANDTAWTNPAVPTTGVAKGVAIYATWSGSPHPLKDTLPEYWARIWDSTVQISVPKYYFDNSLGQYRLQITPKGRTNQFCFVSDSQPVGLNGGAPFTRDILRKADDSINFANYDADGDNVVDALILLIVNVDFGGYRGSLLAVTEFVTKDSANNQPIKIQGGLPGHATGQFATSEATAMYVCTHEWGHALGSFDKPHLGSFSIMNNAGGVWEHRPTPVDPEERIRYGWITPIPVTAPLFGQTIPDYLTTGTVYQLTAPAIPGNLITGPQHFWVTNYKGVPPVGPGVWEEHIPGSGLLIWHRQTGAPALASDLELPHGMYQYDLVNCIRLQPDSVSGKDSLDLTTCGYTGTGRGTRSGIWPYLPSGLPAKINFDGKSNPTSNAWFRSTGSAQQVGTSHIGVRNVQSTDLGPATADLLVNNWFGHITENTTWGPNKIFAITGDIIVDSGKTLTIDSCTNIHFQANEDNQKAMPDTTRSAIVVKPGGKLIIRGTAAFPVQFLSSKPEAQAGTEDWRGIVIKPGGYFACSNAVIRHAYAAIEDSSNFSHTIKNVRIGRCKMRGIQAVNTDSLIIRNCTIDSVNANPGGAGIWITTQDTAGPSLIKNTIRSCFYGIYNGVNITPIESCRVEGPGNTGIYNAAQAGSGYDLQVKNTVISGQFSYHFQNNTWGRAELAACSLASLTSPRSAYGAHSSATSTHLKLRRNVITEWQTAGVLLAHNSGQTADLGTSSDSGNNTIYTSMTGSTWKYVLDNDCGSCTTPVISAERNCWGTVSPSSSRFSGNIDFNPYSTFCVSVPDPKIASGGGDGVLPNPTELYQNYPNPFNPTTLIQFNLERTEPVRLEIFNILGQKVRTMLRGEEFSAGPYTFLWNGRDDGGNNLSSGVYFYRLATPSFSKTLKMTLVK